MSNQNNEDFIRTTLSLGMAFSNILQRSQEQQRNHERKLEVRRAQIKASAKKDELLARKNTLANRLVTIIEKMTDSSAKEIAQARLDQILHSELSVIPDYEQLVDSSYPESVIVIPTRPSQTIERTYQPRQHTSVADLINILTDHRTFQTAKPEVKEDEKKINISKFSELERLADDIKSGNLTCAICLEKFAKEDKDVEIRRCLHAFHKKCLTTWENTGRTNGKVCPTCRQ